MSLITIPTFNLRFPSYLRKGLVLELLMNEGKGDKVYDTSGNRNHGTIYGAKWVKLPNGKWVLYFDGVDDYVEVLDSPSLNPTKAITVEALIKPIVDMYGGTTWTCIRKANNQYLMEPGDVGTNYWAFGVNIGGTFYRVDTDGPIPIKQWHHFVGLYDSSKGVLQIWVDGKLRGSRSLTGEIQVQSGSLFIGKWRSEIFIGYIAFVRIYNRALNEAEIKFLYELAKHLVPLG